MWRVLGDSRWEPMVSLFVSPPLPWKSSLSESVLLTFASLDHIKGIGRQLAKTAEQLDV